MSYKFKVSESFADGLGRISAEQAERVRACLLPDQDVHKGVHEARKSLKRLRALLALYQAGLEHEDYRHLDHCYRDIARGLSGTREIQGMLDSLLHLESRFGRLGRNRLLVALRGQLEESRSQVIAKGSAATQSGEGFERALADAGEQLAALRFAQDNFEIIRPGLEKTYRAARRWHKRAFEAGSGESFHEWRKALQRHWRHMQLLTPAWPHELRARAQFLRTISETVGQDHDLTVLDGYLVKSGRTLGTVVQVRACRALCLKRQEELRAAVRSDGEKLFAEGAAAFSKRVGRYWQMACLERDSTTREMEPAEAV
jgi:CHAD domain-containing protein